MNSIHARIAMIRMERVCPTQGRDCEVCDTIATALGLGPVVADLSRIADAAVAAACRTVKPDRLQRGGEPPPFFANEYEGLPPPPAPLVWTCNYCGCGNAVAPDRPLPVPLGTRCLGCGRPVVRTNVETVDGGFVSISVQVARSPTYPYRFPPSYFGLGATPRGIHRMVDELYARVLRHHREAVEAECERLVRLGATADTVTIEAAGVPVFKPLTDRPCLRTVILRKSDRTPLATIETPLIETILPPDADWRPR